MTRKSIALVGRRWVKGNRLLIAVAKMLAAAVIVSVASWFLIGFALNGFWTWSLPPGGTTRADAVRIVLTVVAGTGGITALTIAYRRQNGIEEARFMERLTFAARQLGDEEPTVQFAGIYALSALADESEQQRQQQCVNVLCGYLRLPYAGFGQPSLLRQVVNTRTWNHGTGHVEETKTYQMRPADREVRLTIIREISAHLQQGANSSWSKLDLDFSGAVFDQGDFSGSEFAGEIVSFEHAQFVGGFINFSNTQFTGGDVTFYNAKFSSKNIHFDNAIFKGRKVNFYKARFISGEVSFIDAEFAGGTTSFRQADFCGGLVSFLGTRFLGGEVTFERSGFTSGKVDFMSSEFSGTKISFTNAKFFGAEIKFDRAHFDSGEVCFQGALVDSGKIDFRSACFTGGQVCFESIHLTGGEVSFLDAQFTDGKVTFFRAYFEGTAVVFRGSSGRIPGMLDFEDPTTWRVTPEVSWTTENVPEWVVPQKWPPVIAGKI